MINKKFLETRLKFATLTSLVGFVISLVFSIVVFIFAMDYFKSELSKYTNSQSFIKDDMKKVKTKLLKQLAFMDIGILTTSFVLGFIVSDYYLSPIELMIIQQRRFLSDAAHELKTPITSIKLALEIDMLDENLDEKVLQMLKNYSRDIQELENLIQNILDLSKLSSAYIKSWIKPEKLDLKKQAQIVIQKMHNFSKRKKVKILLRSQDNIYFLADKRNIQKLFTIFLDNAIKYTDFDSQVIFSIKKTKKHIVINFEDEGPGIKEDDIQAIFQPFFRSYREYIRNSYEGFGLGLSIAERIVSIYKGKIFVKNLKPSGTRFTILLPKNIRN